MTDKELIKQEVERLKMEYDKESIFRTVRGDTAREVFGKLLSFIDSLPEEPASKDLEDEIERFLDEDENIPSYSKTARHFAEWQKQQMKEALQTEYEKGRFDMREEMMKMAVDTAGLSLSWVKDSKTKIIIIEEEQQ